MWKLWVAEFDGSWRVLTGHSRDDWFATPWEGIQLLLVKLDMVKHGKSRVGWYRDEPGIWGEVGYYWWGVEDYPEGITPDAVLDRWRERTGRTDVTLGDLSLDDFQAIGVKIGRSIPNEQFEALLQEAINDTEIR